MRLTPNFHLREFTRSQTAARAGIPNEPSKNQIATLRFWCEEIGEPARERFDAPVRISSGFRSPALNKAVGGSPNSQHQRGEAADFEVVGHSNLEVARFVRDELFFDQLILEFWDGRDPHSGWIHCSVTRGCRARGEVLQMVKGKGYVRGLPE